MKDIIIEKEVKDLNEKRMFTELTLEELEQVTGGSSENGEPENEPESVQEKRKVSQQRKRENKRKALEQFAKILQGIV